MNKSLFVFMFSCHLGCGYIAGRLPWNAEVVRDVSDRIQECVEPKPPIPVPIPPICPIKSHCKNTVKCSVEEAGHCCVECGQPCPPGI